MTLSEEGNSLVILFSAHCSLCLINAPYKQNKGTPVNKNSVRASCVMEISREIAGLFPDEITKFSQDFYKNVRFRRYYLLQPKTAQ